MKKVHIASLFASIGVGGGVEKIQANLSLGLTDLGYMFTHLILDDKKPRNTYAGNIHTFAQPFIVGFGLKKILSLFSLARQVKKYCSQENVDVLIGQGDFFFMVTGLSKLLGNKASCVAVVHTSIGIWNRGINLLMRCFLKIHHAVVITSQQELDTFLHTYHFPKDKLHLIHNAIDIPDLLLQAKIPLSAKHEELFARSQKNFINVARLNYQKNQALLIRAFAALDAVDTQLFLIGDGEERAHISKLIDELGVSDRVHLLGNQTNPHQFVARADFRVLSSRFEGFPMVLIEGGVLKKKIIALDCPTGPREFLDPENKLAEITEDFAIADHGLLVKYDKEKSIHHLTQAMEYILAHNTEKMTETLETYCQRFDNSHNAKQRDLLIQSLDT